MEKMKKCLIFETLGDITNLTKVNESNSEDGLIRLSGVFGVAGIKNQNNRIYDKENYKTMVESLQKAILETGCLGELEHPNSMNIDLNNVSHKIESIEMNEDGTVTGTVVLLNTPKGKIAQAIIEGGSPLFISSRAAGTITNEGKVTLSSLKTYDLVGTPGFSQAKLTLKENQTVECLNENLDEGNYIYAIVEGDDLLGGDDDKDDSDADDLLGGGDSDKKDDKEDKKEKKADKDSDDKEEKKEKKEDKDKDKKDNNEDKKDNKNTDKDINMTALKEAIDKLTEKVTSLEAQLHIAKESLDDVQSVKPVNYAAIQQWVVEEFGESFKDEINDLINEQLEEIVDVESVIDSKIEESVVAIANGVQNWVSEEFAPEVQNWVTEEFAPEVQNWVTEEFAPEVQNWVTEEFAPEVQNWVTEEFAPEVQNWITEEYSPIIEGWITEEYGKEQIDSLLEAQKETRLENIDALLESISGDDNKLQQIVKETKAQDKWAGVYVVENMPAEYIPSWQLLSEARQEEIVRTSRAYDFTKEGVLESFWNNQDLTETKAEEKPSTASTSVNESYYNNIMRQMKALHRY